MMWSWNLSILDIVILWSQPHRAASTAADWLFGFLSQSFLVVFLFSQILLIFSPIQILSSQHISLPCLIWLHPPSPTTSSLRAQRARCQERRQRPAPALLASSVTASMKTSFPSTAPSWLLWWWAWWPTLFLKGQLLEKDLRESCFSLKDIITIGFWTSAVII